MSVLALVFILSSNIDETISDRIHTIFYSNISEDIFSLLSHSADGVTIGASLLSYSFLGDTSEYKTMKTALFAYGLTAAIVTTLKYITARDRPTGEVERINSSFPSGHTAGAFVTYEIFSNRYIRLRVPLFLWATSVGISRVYLRRHWPSDILAGAIIGILVGKFALHNQKRILEFNIF